MIALHLKLPISLLVNFLQVLFFFPSQPQYCIQYVQVQYTKELHLYCDIEDGLSREESFNKLIGNSGVLAIIDNRLLS